MKIIVFFTIKTQKFQFKIRFVYQWIGQKRDIASSNKNKTNILLLFKNFVKMNNTNVLLLGNIVNFVNITPPAGLEFVYLGIMQVAFNFEYIYIYICIILVVLSINKPVKFLSFVFISLFKIEKLLEMGGIKIANECHWPLLNSNYWTLLNITEQAFWLMGGLV